MSKRLGYVCNTCGDEFVTPRGFKVHADRDHSYDNFGERPKAQRRWIEVDE